MEIIYQSYADYEPDYDFPYIPELAEDGEEFYWKDFVETALGNITYAQELVARSDWAFPTTMVDEDIREDAIVFNEEIGTLDYNEEEVGEMDRCVYDENFFDPDCALYV